MGRGKQWNYTEDEALVRAWISVSVDAVVGKDQQNVQFWKKIESSFRKKVAHTNVLTSAGDYEARTPTALRNRWQMLSRDVGTFVGVFNKVDRLNESGKTDEDKERDALKLYVEQEGSKSLTSLSCPSSRSLSLFGLFPLKEPPCFR
jgi:hypothetical protein